MECFIVVNCLLNVLLMLPSITGNVFVLVAILRISSLRSPSTAFLCSLAVSDLLVGMVVQPFYIAHQLNPGLRLKDAFDAYSSLSCGVSLCKVTAISVDRFLALHYHMRYPNLMTDNRAMYISLVLDDPCIMSLCMEHDLCETNLRSRDCHLYLGFYFSLHHNLSNCSKTSASDSYTTASSTNCWCWS